MLFPRESETRTVIDLSGIWDFRFDTAGEGLRDRWYAGPLQGAQPMPVPASYNDLVQDAAMRDHIGWVWYRLGLV
jgi:beta-glucuronidase